MTSPNMTQDRLSIAFTNAERVRQLNDIDIRIVQLLKSAGLALKILAANQASNEPVAERKEAFEKATNSYLSNLHGVDLGLKRQIWGLEEAEIIIEKKPKESRDHSTGGEAKPEKGSKSGTGRLDIGWLNSRSGTVGRDNEAELWARSRTFLEVMNRKWAGERKADCEGGSHVD